MTEVLEQKEVMVEEMDVEALAEHLKQLEGACPGTLGRLRRAAMLEAVQESPETIEPPEIAGADEAATVDAETAEKERQKVMKQLTKHWPMHRTMLLAGYYGAGMAEAAAELIREYGYRDADGNVMPIEDEVEYNHDDQELAHLTECLEGKNPHYQKMLLERYAAEVLPQQYKKADHGKAVEEAVCAFAQQIDGWKTEEIQRLPAALKGEDFWPELTNVSTDNKASDDNPAGADVDERVAQIQEIINNLKGCHDDLFDLIHRTLDAGSRPESSTDTVDEYALSTLGITMFGYRPLFQRRILHEYIEQLPPDEGKDDLPDAVDESLTKQYRRAKVLKDIVEGFGRVPDEYLDFVRETFVSVLSILDKPASAYEEKGKPAAEPDDSGDESVDEDAGETEDDEHRLTVNFFESLATDELLAAVGLTIALGSETRGISEIANRYCNQFEAQIKRAASQLMANQTVTGLECEEPEHGAKIMFVAGLLENR